MIKALILGGSGLLLTVAGMYLCAWLNFVLDAQHWATEPTLIVLCVLTGIMFISSITVLSIALTCIDEEV